MAKDETPQNDGATNTSENSVVQANVENSQNADSAAQSGNADANSDNVVNPTTNNAANPAVTPEKKSHKKLIIGLAAGIGGFFAILIALILILTLGRISKADYSDALGLTQAAYRAAPNLFEINSASRLSGSAAEEKVRKLDDEFAKFKEEFNKIGDAKAVKKDKELREDYAELRDEFAAYEEYYKTGVEVLEFNDIVKSVSSINSSSYDKVVAGLQSAQKELQTIEIKYELNKKYKKDLDACISNMVAAAEKYYSAYKANKYDSSAYSELLDATSQCNRADTDHREAMQEKYDDANDFKNNLYKLTSELRNKMYKTNSGGNR